MAHIERLRKGWQSENLARLILYNFAFVSEPVKVADDIGIDMFCTLFKREARNRDLDLIPKSSFAIQVKSDKRAFDLKKHLFQLNNLEIPYLIGVADKKNLLFSIFSGEYLPHFCSFFGWKDDDTNKIHNVKVKLCARSSFDNMKGWWTRSENRVFTLRFPEIVTFDAKEIEKSLNQKIEMVSEVIDLIQTNISLRKSGRSILRVYGTEQMIAYRGRGSAENFEKNFAYGLDEVFQNLQHLFQSSASRDYALKVFPTYETIYHEFRKAYGENPFGLETVFNETKIIAQDS